MDNITHSMVGAALGQAGLKKYTGLGMATLMIAANLPDVDALAAPFTDLLAFRRGWTHGPLGLLMLPIPLAAAMVGLDSFRRRRAKGRHDRPPVRPWLILALAYIGILTHPFLDWLNTYGIRFLMPFSREWFYGDALFIIDPWIWLVLGAGIFLSCRRERHGRGSQTGPVVLALGVVVLYIGLMVAGSRAASRTAADEIEAQNRGPVERIMTGPIPVNSFQREIIYDRGDAYGFGTLTFAFPPRVSLEPEMLAKQDNHPAVREAMRHQTIRDFLVWSRFPFFQIEEVDEGTRVEVGDARFSRNAWRSWALRSVVIE